MIDTVYLYHIRRFQDSGKLDEGYVGISNNPARRFATHKRGGHNVHLDNALTKYADAEMVIVSEGTRKEMLEMEAWLRPTKHIGWNVAAGGCMPPTWDEIADPEAKKRAISEYMSNRVVTDEIKRRLSVANTGKTHSDETRRKLSDIGKTKTGKANNNFKGWWEVDNIQYESLTIAAAALDIKWPTIRSRCKSDNFPAYKFIPKETN